MHDDVDVAGIIQSNFPICTPCHTSEVQLLYLQYSMCMQGHPQAAYTEALELRGCGSHGAWGHHEQQRTVLTGHQVYVPSAVPKA